MCVCVRACVRACACMRACVRACARVCVRAWVCAHACVHWTGQNPWLKITFPLYLHKQDDFSSLSLWLSFFSSPRWFFSPSSIVLFLLFASFCIPYGRGLGFPPLTLCGVVHVQATALSTGPTRALCPPRRVRSASCGSSSRSRWSSQQTRSEIPNALFILSAFTKRLRKLVLSLVMVLRVFI